MKTLFKLFLVILQFGCQATVADSSTSEDENVLTLDNYIGTYTVSSTLERVHLKTGVEDTLTLSGLDELKTKFYGNVYEIVIGENYSEKKYHLWSMGINFDTIAVGGPCILSSSTNILNDSIITNIEICGDDREEHWVRFDDTIPIDTIIALNEEEETDVVCDTVTNCNSKELIVLPGVKRLTINRSYLIVDDNTLSKSWAVLSRKRDEGILNKRYDLHLVDSLYAVYNQADSIAKYNDLSVGTLTNTFIKQ